MNINQETTVRNYWDKTWGKFLKYQGMIAPSGKLVQHLISQVERGGVVLDLGCGEGRNTIYLSRVGYRAVGLDLSAKGVRALLNNLFEEEVRAQALIGDARELPFPANSFDGILAHNLFDHMDAEGFRKSLAECYRLLKPGAVLLMTLDAIPGNFDSRQAVERDDGSWVYVAGMQKGMLIRPWNETELQQLQEQGWEAIKDEMTPRKSKILLWRKKVQST